MKYFVVLAALIAPLAACAGTKKSTRNPASSGQQFREDVANFARKHGLRQFPLENCPLADPDSFTDILFYQHKKTKKIYRITDASFQTRKGQGDVADTVMATNMETCQDEEFAL